MNLQILHDAATAAAKNATIQHLTKHGEDFYCGFAWVKVSEKASTKLGRALKSIGFTKAYGGGLHLPAADVLESIRATARRSPRAVEQD